MSSAYRVRIWVVGVVCALLGALCYSERGINLPSNHQVITGSRVILPWQKWAFLGSASKVRPRWYTPRIAILAQGVCTMLMTVTLFAPRFSELHGIHARLLHCDGRSALFHFCRQLGWQKLPAVSFRPLIPESFLIPDVEREPLISLATILAMVTGALVYHRLRSNESHGPAVETY